MSVEQIKQKIKELRENQTWLCSWSSPAWFRYEREIARLSAELTRLSQ